MPVAAGISRGLQRWAAAFAALALAVGAAYAQDSKLHSPGRNLEGHGGPVRGLTISDDGKQALTASFDYAAMVWNLEVRPPRAVQRLLGHDGPVNDALFVKENRALTGSDDGTLALWDLETGEMLRRFEGHAAKVVDVAISPDGTLAASASWDRTVGLWRIADGALIAQLKGHTGPVNAIGFPRTASISIQAATTAAFASGGPMVARQPRSAR